MHGNSGWNFVRQNSEKQGESDVCWLCARGLGSRTQWHHPVPKSRGGRLTVPVHPVCHRAIHAHFSNAELARIGDCVNTLTANPQIDKFIKWIAGKPSDFYVRTANPASRRGN